MSPFYEYRCDREHLSEIHVSLTSRPTEIKCPVCGKPAQRIVSKQLRPIVKGGTPIHHHTAGRDK